MSCLFYLVWICSSIDSKFSFILQELSSYWVIYQLRACFRNRIQERFSHLKTNNNLLEKKVVVFVELQAADCRLEKEPHKWQALVILRNIWQRQWVVENYWIMYHIMAIGLNWITSSQRKGSHSQHLDCINSHHSLDFLSGKSLHWNQWNSSHYSV